MRLKDGSRKRKDDLQAQLARTEKISSEDEAWLNNDANHVEEEALVNDLQGAEDYDAALQKLTSAQKEMTENLRRLAYEGVQRTESCQAEGKEKKVQGKAEHHAASKNLKRKRESKL